MSTVEPIIPIEVRDLFLPERERLLELLSDLTPQEWDRPTVCPGWTVKDVALHLLGVDVGNLSRRRDGFTDPWWDTAPGELVTALNHWNETWVVAARRLSPRLLCELLRGTGEELRAYFWSLDPSALGGSVSWAGPDPAPVWLDIAREYTERWVHQQQIRDALDRPDLTEPRYLGPVLATFVHALPQTLREVDAPPGTALRLLIKGEAGGGWMAVREGDRWVLGLDTGGRADATVHIDQDTAWRLWTRGIAPGEAVQRIQIEGECSLGLKVLEMVSIIA